MLFRWTSFFILLSGLAVGTSCVHGRANRDHALHIEGTREPGGGPIAGLVVTVSAVGVGGTDLRAEVATGEDGRAQLRWLTTATGDGHRLEPGRTYVAEYRDRFGGLNRAEFVYDGDMLLDLRIGLPEPPPPHLGGWKLLNPDSPARPTDPPP